MTAATGSALVVYESLHGHTARVAEAIASGLRFWLPAVALPVTNAPAHPGDDVRLLVVGGPHPLLRVPACRAHHAEDLLAEHTAAGGRRLLAWLAQLPPPTAPILAHAFDTRAAHPSALGCADHAAREEERLLRAAGYSLAMPAEPFFLATDDGPLVPGEGERAYEWGRTLAAEALQVLAGALAE